MMNSKCYLKSTQFPCRICRLNVKENAKVIQCDLRNYGVYIECNHPKNIGYKYFQGSKGP